MKCLWIVSSVISFRSVLALNPNVILACLKRLNALKHWAAATYRAKKSIELLPHKEPKSWNPRHSDVVDYHLAFPDHLRWQLCIVPVTMYIFPTNFIIFIFAMFSLSISAHPPYSYPWGAETLTFSPGASLPFWPMRRFSTVQRLQETVFLKLCITFVPISLN